MTSTSEFLNKAFDFPAMRVAEPPVYRLTCFDEADQEIKEVFWKTRVWHLLVLSGGVHFLQDVGSIFLVSQAVLPLPKFGRLQRS
jgi:hypothetical protein